MSTSQPATAIRSLGSLEQLFAAYGQAGAMVFSIAAQVNRQVSRSTLESAINSIALRHPLLQASIGLNDEGVSSFLTSAMPISVSIETGSILSWPQVAAREVASPLQASSGPLVRVRAITDKASTVLVISFHHSAADGVSAITVLRDLLTAIAGGHLEAGKVPDSLDTLLGREPELFKCGVSPETDAGIERHFQDVAVTAVEFDRSEATRLFGAAKKHGVSVHSMLTVALTRAHFAVSTETGGKSFSVMSPIDLKPMLGVADDTGLHLSIGIVPFENIESEFWTAAEAVGDKLKSLRSPTAASGFLAAISKPLHADVSMEATAKRLVANVPYDGVMTNLGVLNLSHRYGDLVLERVWAPVLRSLPGQDVVAAATFGGVLSLVQTSVGEPNGLIQKMAQILRSLD